MQKEQERTELKGVVLGVPDFHLCVLQICNSASSLSIFGTKDPYILNPQK
jgi:hypothetical protein